MAFMWSRERVIAMCGALGSLADQVFGCVKVRVLLYRCYCMLGQERFTAFSVVVLLGGCWRLLGRV